MANKNQSKNAPNNNVQGNKAAENDKKAKPQPKQEPEMRSKVNPKIPPKEPIIEPEVVETKAESVEKGKPSSTVPKSMLSAIGRLSPDAMVQFSGQLERMYVNTDSPEAGQALAAIRINHAYLMHLAAIQIGEDSQSIGMTITQKELAIMTTAATALKTNIISVLPNPENKEQLKLEFDKNTIPEEVADKVKKEEERMKVEIDTDPTKSYNAKELKEILLHILTPSKGNSRCIIDAIEWYRNNQILVSQKHLDTYAATNGLDSDEKKEKNSEYQTFLKAHNTIINTKRTDWFNDILNLVGYEDLPRMVLGVMQSVWERFEKSETMIPLHCYIKKLAPAWSDEEIADIAKFIVNHEASKMPDNGKSTFQKVTYLQNPTPEYLQEIVKKAMKSTTPEMTAMQNFYGKLIRNKRTIEEDRVGAVMQAISNLYVDQSDQTKRLALYKDLSEYSENREPEKKN